MLQFLLLLLFFISVLLTEVFPSSLSMPSPPVDDTIISYLQSESLQLSMLQNNLKNNLYQHKISIGLTPGSIRNSSVSNKVNNVEIALSTSKNNYDCRISFDKVPIGQKCIAPCGCTGSGKWIQFSELNRLRRKEPLQWITCQTCQQKFNYNSLIVYGGIQGNIVSLLLDNKKYLRILVGFMSLILGHVLSLHTLVTKLLVSRLFWQQYPKWSRIVHLPLVMKFWGAKLLGQYLLSKYLIVEDKVMLKLTELETSLIEPYLPLTVDN